MAASFVEEVPEYEVRNGHMRIDMGCCVIVMPVHIFLRGMRRARAALNKWEEERPEGRVVLFQRRH